MKRHALSSHDMKSLKLDLSHTRMALTTLQYAILDDEEASYDVPL